MPDDARDPPDDEDPSSDDADDPPDSDDDPPEEPDEPVEGDDPTSPPLDPAVVTRFLTSKDARKIAQNAIRKLVPGNEVDELADEAIFRALKAKPPRLEIVLPAWLIQIARRRAIRWLEKRKRRSAYEGPMPTHVAREDDYTGEAVETVDPSDTSYDPTSDEEPAELLGTHLDHFIGDHVRDQEVRAIIREHSEEGKTYTDIAAARGLTEAQIANRILRFKKKYATRVTRRRTLFAVFKVLGWLAFGAFVFAVTWWLLHRRSDDIRPDPSRAVPSSSPSSSSSAPVFLQALPPGPDPSEQPPKPERLKP